MGSETRANERQSVFLSEYRFREKKVQGQTMGPLKLTGREVSVLGLKGVDSDR